MTTVQRWTGKETRALRLSLRLTVRGFAADLGVGVRTVANWEAGGSGVVPRPELQAALDTLLGRADLDAQDRFARSLGGQSPVESEDAGAELRGRLAAASAVDTETIRLLTAQLNDIRAMDRMLGAETSAPQLSGYLDTVKGLRSFTIGNRETLADLYADAATLAGWQCLDTGCVGAAWRHYEAAKEAGREGRSRSALVHALAEQTYVLLEINDIGRAAELAEYACSLAAGRVPALLSSWLWAVRGEVHAAAGNISDCHAAFEAAARALPTDPLDPDLPFVVLSEVHLARWRGNAWATLGDQAAIIELEAALDRLDESFVRARAGLHADLAGAFLARKRPEPASAHLQAGEALATRVGSVRQQRRMSRIRSALVGAAG
ncbi:helix-turn-helix domain-containing protein [Actinoplanes sp. NPDC051859]|uniref:helix-turn-helix domain-containing protein n=1 Tax=Actinoplanes sp. NPDC051859 TaxID=3363909 RepID=UPI0037A3A189